MVTQIKHDPATQNSRAARLAVCGGMLFVCLSGCTSGRLHDLFSFGPGHGYATLEELAERERQDALAARERASQPPSRLKSFGHKLAELNPFTDSDDEYTQADPFLQISPDESRTEPTRVAASTAEIAADDKLPATGTSPTRTAATAYDRLLKADESTLNGQAGRSAQHGSDPSEFERLMADVHNDVRTDGPPQADTRPETTAGVSGKQSAAPKLTGFLEPGNIGSDAKETELTAAARQKVDSRVNELDLFLAQSFEGRPATGDAGLSNTGFDSTATGLAAESAASPAHRPAESGHATGLDQLLEATNAAHGSAHSAQPGSPNGTAPHVAAPADVFGDLLERRIGELTAPIGQQGANELFAASNSDSSGEAQGNAFQWTQTEPVHDPDAAVHQQADRPMRGLNIPVTPDAFALTDVVPSTGGETVTSASDAVALVDFQSQATGRGAPFGSPTVATAADRVLAGGLPSAVDRVAATDAIPSVRTAPSFASDPFFSEAGLADAVPGPASATPVPSDAPVFNVLAVLKGTSGKSLILVIGGLIAAFLLFGPAQKASKDAA